MIDGLEAEIKVAGRHDRPGLRTRRDMARQRLDQLLAVPPLVPSDMCGDCPAPAAEHEHDGSGPTRPCIAWPAAGARIRRAWQMLDPASLQQHAEQGQEPPGPQPGE